MVQIHNNPHRGKSTIPQDLTGDVLPERDPGNVARLLALCPAHAATPLHEAAELAEEAGVGRLLIKDESGRMGLGSFKALGAAFAIARDAEAAQADAWEKALAGQVYVTASAGNHGMSVAAGAALFGARAVIYIAETVPEAFAERLRSKGATVVREGAIYEDSMAAAEQAASDQGWTLLSDSSWPGYTRLPRNVMEGYLQMGAEVAAQCDTAPTHILLQAGVGGMAAALAAFFRSVWGDAPQIVVVEPEAAPALIESIRAGRLTDTEGPVSDMGRLDCKTPSMIALHGLAADADVFATISEEEASAATRELGRHGYATTSSGGAGVAALLAGLPGCDRSSTVLTVLSEGPEDG